MSVRILIGDCRERLRELPDESIHCVVTSPPYFGLRDYDADGQIGHEASHLEFVATMVDVFREVRRVLRSDGTAWLNLGDSYCSRPNGSIGKESSLEGAFTSHTEFRRAHALRKPGLMPGLKHKDLMGIPWRVALALQDDGWWLRRDIIWEKTNGMPESVKDRCTTSHEYLFHLSKSERYYYDADAISEVVKGDTPARAERGRGEGHKWSEGPGGQTIASGNPSAGRSRRNSFARKTKASAGDHGQKAQHREGRPDVSYEGRRNKRSVWSVPTAAYKGDHFAVYPPQLIEPCILAGCPRGGVVLDPFGGAGTTGLTAERLGRDSILIEINPKTAADADARLRAGLAQVAGTPAPAPGGLPLFEEEAA